MKRVVIIGATGQLGTDLGRELAARSGAWAVTGLGHGDLEICDHDGTRTRLTALRPDVVINTAAYHKTDECELNGERAFSVNTLAVGNLAKVCRELDAELVHMSTDYVFGLDTERRVPYGEDDPCGPLNIYGLSKLAGEHLIRAYWEKSTIIRTAALYGVRGSKEKGGNFVELMLRLAREGKAIKVVSDQTTTPTFTPRLARQIVTLLDGAPRGVYHATCQGECTWHAYAAKIFELAAVKADLGEQTTAQSGAKARRPAYSVLENRALKKAGLDEMPHWEDGLREYFALAHPPGK